MHLSQRVGRPLVFVHSSDELYGADRILLEMISAVPRGTEVEVWLPTDQTQHQLCTELARRGVAYRHLDLPIMRRAYRQPRALLTLLGRVARLMLTLGRARPATVYCTTSAALLAAPAARLALVPRVVCHLQEVWSDRDRPVLSILARSCHSLVAVSTWAADAVGPRLRERTVVVPNATPEPAVRSSLADRTGPLSFVIASRWGPGKGHGTLLTAWDGLGHTTHRLTILGSPPERGEQVDVAALVAGLRRPETVSIVGEVTDPSPYLDAADVMLVPSDYPEGFGLVAIEAFARGRPVVASSAGGLVDVVSGGVDGWLYRPGDVTALTEILTGLDRGKVAAAGEKARASYEQRYTSAAYAERWRAALRA